MRRYGRPSPTAPQDSKGVLFSQSTAPGTERCGVLQHRWKATRGEDMPIRRGEEYLESLRDGRGVWLMGQGGAAVPTHPALAGCARSVAAVYDLQHDAAHQDLLTMPSPTTGQPVSLSYLLPQSVDDLARQRRMYECL